MEKHIIDFLDYLKYERGASENTVDAYARDLKKFIYFLKERNASGKYPELEEISVKTSGDLLADFLKANREAR